MFGAIKNLHNKIARFDQGKVINQALSDPTLQAEIIDLNQRQLYEQGLMPDGTPTGDYSPATIYGTANFAGKIAKGQRYDHITLKDTGKFYDSMKVEIVSEGIKITDTDLKFDMLKEREGNMLGLTQESLAEVRPAVKDEMMNELRNVLKG